MRQSPIFRFFTRLTLLSAVVLIAACSAPRPEENDASPQPETAVVPSDQGKIEVPLAETVPCPVALPEGDVEGTSAFCGQIAVPENWDDPAGKQIALTYAVLKATDEEPAADPIVYFEGGPGISALENLAGKGEDFAHLRRQHDMIFWDQRGNFYSANLNCPDEVRYPALSMSDEELSAQATAMAAAPPAPTLDPALLEPPTLDEDPLDYLAQEQALRAAVNQNDDPVANCRAFYDDQAVALEEYSTASSVLDAVALMQALDYDAYNVYAISYGTTLALETMRYYAAQSAAQLPAIRSVVIDGVSPLAVDLAELSLIQPYNVLRVFADCTADAACAAAYPEIGQRMIDLLDAAEETPLTLDDGSSVTLDDLVAILKLTASNDGVGLAYLPRMIDELERGESAVYGRLQAREAEPVPIGILAADELNLDLSAVIVCNDRAGRLDAATAFDLYRSFDAPQLITDLTPVIGQIVECESWGLMGEPFAAPEPVVSDLRTMVVNGEMDAATAVEWGEAAFAPLTDAIMVTYPQSPHGASVQTACAQGVTAAFFDDPRGEMDLACVDALRPAFAQPNDALPSTEME